MRRADDNRIDKLDSRLDKVEYLLVENTKTTNEVRDILTTFKTLGTFAKWFSSIAAAIVGLWAAIKGYRG
jgi:orotate phosphoribosyltransferase-like protein